MSTTMKPSSISLVTTVFLCIASCLAVPCLDNETLVSSEEYLLLDLKGLPDRVTDDDKAKIESSFVPAYTLLVGDCGDGVNATILSDIIEGYGSDDGSTIESTNFSADREFSYLMWIQRGQCLPCIDCNATSNPLFTSTNEKRVLATYQDDLLSTTRTPQDQRSVLRARQTQSTNVTLNCTPPSKSDLLSQWQQEFEESEVVSEIMDFDLVEFDDGCDMDGVAKYATIVYLILESSSSPTEVELDQLAQGFKEAYNELNALNGDTCDPHKRRLVHTRASILSSSGDNSWVVEIYAAGSCQNCNSQTNLFEIEFGGTRLLQEYNVLSCLCPQDVETLRAPTIGELLDELSGFIDDVGFNLVSLNEKEPLLCESELTHFQKAISIEFEVVCGLLDDDLPILETAVVESYNELASEYYCDPEFKLLESAEYSTIGNRTAESGITVDFLINGTCRGCNPQNVSLFDVDSLTGSGNRFLQSSTKQRDVRRRTASTCYCNTGTIADRGPNEVEFVRALEASVESSSDLLCAASITTCDYGSLFETAIVVSFEDDDVIAEMNKSALEASLMNALNDLYDSSEHSCNSDYRVIESANAILGVDFNPNLVYGRRMQDSTQNGTLTPSLASSVTPSISASPSITPSVSAFPSVTPTCKVFMNNVLFYVAGVCNACEGSIISSTSGSRRLTAGRLLEVDNVQRQDSLCFCPADTPSDNAAVSSEVVQAAYQEQLDMTQLAVNVTSIDEINVEECADDFNTFNTSFSLEVLLNGTNVDELTILVEDTYNALVGGYCDPLDLQNLVFELSRVLPSNTSLDGEQGDCLLYQVQWNVSGECRDCSENTPLLYAEATDQRYRQLDQRNLLSSFDFFPPRARRRRLQGTTLCFCDDDTIPGRSPTLEEFRIALDAVLALATSEDICGLLDEPEETDDPTMSPTEEPCDAVLNSNFTTTVVMDVTLIGGGSLTANMSERLADVMVDVYNDLVQSNSTLCDESFRFLLSATADPLSRRLRNSDFILSSLSKDGSRRAEEETSQELTFRFDGSCVDCPVDANIFDPDTIEYSVFLEALLNATDENMIPIDTIEEFVEIDEYECVVNLTEFSSDIIVEFGVDCIGGLTLDDPEIGAIEEAWVATYNSLSLEYCDPFSRTVQEAKILVIGENTTAGNTPVEMRITATCRGCDPEETDIFGTISSTSAGRRTLGVIDSWKTPFHGSRNLQETEICTCPAQAIGDRAPYESEVVNAYQSTVETFNFTCVDSVATCEQTLFDTGIVVEFEGNASDISSEDIASIEASFQDSVNDLYENSEETCNDEFRVVESVDALVVDEETRRKLVGARGRRAQAESANPSPSPSYTSAPVFELESSTVSVLLYVSGVCNGCSAELTLSDQVVARRDLNVLDSSPRFLQETQSNAKSSCFCQLGAVVESLPPPQDALQSSFTEKLGENNVPYGLRELGEVPVANCDAEPQQFRTRLRSRIYLSPDIKDRDVEALARLYWDAYNGLVGEFCDPLLRRFTDLKVRNYKQEGSLTDQGCVEYRIDFDAVGTCLGCEDDTPLFSPSDRRLEKGKNNIAIHRPIQRRRLLHNSDCFCLGETRGNRAPTMEEFEDRF